MTAVLQELETVETVAPTALPAVELRNALSACVLTVDKSKTLPVLEAVHVVKTGDTLTFSGTDRYRLTQVTVTLGGTRGVTPEGDWSTLINAADVKRIVTMLPKVAAYSGQFATITPDTVSLPAAGSLQFTPVDGEFPRVSKIIPTSTAPVEEIGFNPDYLATVAKMPGLGKNEPVRFKFNGAGKPVLARWGTDEVAYLYLLMPTRVAA